MYFILYFVARRQERLTIRIWMIMMIMTAT